MPTNSQPPPKPPANPGQPRTPPDDALNPGLDERVESLKSAVVSILKVCRFDKERRPAVDTELALGHGVAARLDRRRGKFDKYNGFMPRYFGESVPHDERVSKSRRKVHRTRILDDIYTRLQDASSKTAMKRWKFLQVIKSIASNRPSKCTLLLQTCQDDLLKGMGDLNERLENELAKQADVSSGPQPPARTQTRSSELGDSKTFAPNPPTGTTEQRSTERKTFKGMEIGSGAIPIVGSYVGAAAKVGLAFVETLQTMDRNDILAVDLGDHTSKLNKLVEKFKERSNINEKDVADQIDALHKELVLVNKKVEEWSSLDRFKKAFLAREHGETLKEYQGRIQTAREEMQLLVSVDSRNIIVDLERDRLLKCLGDGQFGARGNIIEDIICFPGTRLEILKHIDEWIRDESSPNPVLWISGMAGRGKSTIASTVVHNWKCRASCAIFHFRRGQTSLNPRVICALVRQLGNSLVSEVREAVLESVRQNQMTAEPGRRLDERFETFLVAPFAKLQHKAHPILIVVDALDENDNPEDAVDLVRLIQKHSPSFPKNVKFLLTSRPEGAIVRNLESGKWRKEDLDSAPDINKDVGEFLQAAFTRIRVEHDLSEYWPSLIDVNQLVRMSQGLFQWARTAIRHIGNGSPVDRLRTLLKRPSAWSGLDDLYHQILSKTFNSLRLDPVRQDILIQVLGTLVVAPQPVSLEVIASLYGKHEIFDGINSEDIITFLRKDVLADLNSLLFIPRLSAEPMRLMHTSIHDLLASKVRCKDQPFYVDSTRSHQQLAKLCFEIMLRELKGNICSLSDVSKPVSKAQDVAQREISQSLQYCCRAWSSHLTQGVRWSRPGECASPSLLEDIDSFSKEKVMCWLEVMSFVEATTDAISAAKHVHQWLFQRPTDMSKHDPLTALWDDIQRFITTFLEPISFGPLHIYASALPHCPTETEMWSLYGKYARIRTLHGHRMSRWPPSLWTRSPNAEVKAVAFSPDGKVVAFGSDDRKIRLLDAQTGAAVGQPLIGHTAKVWSVCFSPDGRFLASGSDDHTIRFWDAETRAAVGDPLIGHNGGVNSVCFLPDGKVVASGSDDKTVRLWSAETGAAMGGPLTGHSDSIWSVCFSPGGKLLASGSQDLTIRLWDPLTGVAVGEPLTGHSGVIRSVCFSPDGSLLASGADDRTIRLWDPESQSAVGELLSEPSGGICSVRFLPDSKTLAFGSGDGTIRLWDTLTRSTRGEPFTGHSAWVGSICFSPDGKLLASGSEDKTVRLWDPQAGAAVAGSLISHSAKVNSVCFSPDGKRVASVYDDHLIRLWDPQTGAAVGEPLTGHSGEVNSVCFSPDGKRLASGSDDGAIRLWDAQTGISVGEPLRGAGRLVLSVCFSPDGKYLACGSSDRTIRLWDVQSGVQVGEPLGGHTNWVWTVCFSPDGKHLASRSSNRTIRLWDPHAGVAVGEPLEGHGSYVFSISFSSDGTLLLARCDDGSLATWDVTTRQRCDTPRSHPFYANPRFQDHWVTFGSSRFLWLPPQYWDMNASQWALRDGRLVAFPNGSPSILDVSQVFGTLAYEFR